MCEELISSGKMDTATIQFDNKARIYVSRGGLMKPSDVVYSTCTLAYGAYEALRCGIQHMYTCLWGLQKYKKL